MKPAFLPISILSLAACASMGAEPTGLVDNPYYRAAGAGGWTAEVGDDIVLRLGHHVHGGEIGEIVYRYPGRRPTHHGESRRWRAGGRRGILIEARPGPCTGADGQVLPDRVRVVHFQGEWEGCGGPWLGENRS